MRCACLLLASPPTKLSITRLALVSYPQDDVMGRREEKLNSNGRAWEKRTMCAAMPHTVHALSYNSPT